MKDLFKSFTSFTRTERLGLIGLSALLVILLTVRTTMHFWVKPRMDEQKEKELQIAWDKFKKEHTDSSAHNDIGQPDTVTADK